MHSNSLWIVSLYSETNNLVCSSCFLPSRVDTTLQELRRVPTTFLYATDKRFRSSLSKIGEMPSSDFILSAFTSVSSFILYTENINKNNISKPILLLQCTLAMSSYLSACSAIFALSINFFSEFMLVSCYSKNQYQTNNYRLCVAKCNSCTKERTAMEQQWYYTTVNQSSLPPIGQNTRARQVGVYIILTSMVTKEITMTTRTTDQNKRTHVIVSFLFVFVWTAQQKGEITV